MPEVLVHIPTGGQIEANCVRSVCDLISRPPKGWEFSGPEISIGPYLTHNVEAGMQLARSGGFDWMLRVDSDMAWPVDYARHFFGQVEVLLEMVGRAGFQGTPPLLIGGVYPRRQKATNHVPVTSYLPLSSGCAPGLMREWLYFRWAECCYQHGCLLPAERIGGGFTLMNRDLLMNTTHRDFAITLGQGEDYRLSAHVHDLAASGYGGAGVYAVWPASHGIELLHGHATELVSLGDYFCRARARMHRLDVGDAIDVTEPFAEMVRRGFFNLDRYFEARGWAQ